MCCFAGEGRPYVSNTRIFARRLEDRQLLVYEMRLRTSAPVAMILPLPVAPGAGEDALQFIDMSDDEALFDDLDCGFPEPMALGEGPVPAGPGRGTLAVERVGAFEASYVPSLADFARLDPRFRIDDRLWHRLPGYRDAGFAVFQLRQGERRVHPMAFDFPARWPERLLFPTVHIHHGELEATADFDHSLYFQGFDAVDLAGRRLEPGRRYLDVSGVVAQLSDGPAGEFCRPLVDGVIDLDAPAVRLQVRGRLRNDDIWLVPDPAEPAVAVTGKGPSAWVPVA